MVKPLAFIGTRLGNDGLLQAAEDMKIPIAGWFDRYYANNTKSFSGYPILGSELDITDEDKEKYDFFLASFYAGHPVLDNQDHNGQKLRQERIQLIREKKLPLINLITSTAYIHPTVQLGKGLYFGHNTMIRANCVLNDFSYFCHGVALGHDVETEEDVIILAQSVISGNVLIKQSTMIGINCTIINGYYDKKLIVGKNAKIAAGAVVYRDVDSNKFISVEGRRMRKLDSGVE